MTKSTDKLRVALDTRRITLAHEGREDEWRIDQVRQASKAYGRAWSIVFLEAARAMATCPMAPAAGQVLWWAIGNLHPRDWTVARHESIALQVGLTRSAVTKALRELKERGLIQAGPNSSLRLTLFFGWQGTAQAYQKAKRGRAAEIEQARAWAKAHAHAEGEAERFWRIGDDDGDTATGPRERHRAEKRGGDARSIGNILPKFPGVKR